MHSIQRQRREARQAIDQATAEARQRHITGLAGQDMVYSAKLAEARAYLAEHAGNPAAPVPPYVAVDVAVDGGSAVARARAIVSAAEAFHRGPGPAIEQARRTGKLAIAAASTHEAVRAALDTALAALQAV